MKLTIKMLDPTGGIVSKEILDLPIKVDESKTSLDDIASKNYYIVEFGSLVIEVNKLGITKVISNKK